MSAELIGLIIGAIFIVPTIYYVRKKQWDGLTWPLFLVSLPIYYMLFGVLAWDGSAVLNELLYGLPFIAIGLLVWKMNSKMALYIIAAGWLCHGFYDFYHDAFFVNPGVFNWYPAFCALVDVSVAMYLLIDQERITESFGDRSEVQ